MGISRGVWLAAVAVAVAGTGSGRAQTEARLHPAPRACRTRRWSSADNPLTAEKVMLGKQLFFDKRLSKDGRPRARPATCPRRAGPTACALDQGRRRVNTRHSPTLINVGYYPTSTGTAAPRRWRSRSRPPGRARWAPTPTRSPRASGDPRLPDGVQDGAGRTAHRRPRGQGAGLFLRTLRTGDTPWDHMDAQEARQERGRSRLRGLPQGGRLRALPRAAHVHRHALPQCRHRLRHGEARPGPRQDPGRQGGEGVPSPARRRRRSRRLQDADACAA